MAGFEPFDVVAVPFPYVDRDVRKRRPAIVVSRGRLAHEHGLLWVVMVTSAGNRPWAGDIPIIDLALAGLPKPSVVRPSKIATVEAERCEPVGRLRGLTAQAVAGYLRDAMAV